MKSSINQGFLPFLIGIFIGVAGMSFSSKMNIVQDLPTLHIPTVMQIGLTDQGYLPAIQFLEKTKADKRREIIRQ